jgi:hypothetical protein
MTRILCSDAFFFFAGQEVRGERQSYMADRKFFMEEKFANCMSDVATKRKGVVLKIDSSTIGMESARSYQSGKTTTRRFKITEYQQTLENNSDALNTAVKDNSAGETEENSAAKDAQEENTSYAAVSEWQNRFGVSASRLNIRSSTENTITDIRQLSLRYIFNLLFSSRADRFNDLYEDTGMSSINSGTYAASYSSQTSSWQSNVTSAAQTLNGALSGITTRYKVLSYSQESYEWEQEDTSFSTVGTVKTSDGREINFNINVGMSRAFEQYYSEDLQVAQFTLCDPLVINMDTDAAELSDQTFYFDIDADGELDEVSELGAGSGYLALDKNGDGVINDGSELFGTASGNGFKDLAEYDDDGNGWIDENDAVWSKLQIWTKDEDGNDRLYRLADKGVGAICLQNTATDYTLKGDEGQTKGAIRNTGIFLYENGNVGTVQHVDVAKYAMQA